MKTAIVVPAHIPPTPEWIDALKREAEIEKADVLIVDDSNGRLGELPKDWRVFDCDFQQAFLGELYDGFGRMFHKCSACRVFGHIVAYSEGYEIIIGLDSDCVVRPGFVREHSEMLEGKYKGSGWQNPLENIYAPDPVYSRGLPYHMRNWPIVANMGLWEGCLDLNGKDRHTGEPTRTGFPLGTFATAVAPIPFSGMNFALRREALPGFLFLPNFDYEGGKFRRIDDIWGGYIFQKLARKRREAVSYGHPIVDHVSVVDAAADAAEEAAMYKWEESFLNFIDRGVSGNDKSPYLDMYKSIVVFFQAEVKGGYYPEFHNLLPALEWWVKVWEKYEK